MCLIGHVLIKNECEKGLQIRTHPSRIRSFPNFGKFCRIISLKNNQKICMSGHPVPGEFRKFKSNSMNWAHELSFWDTTYDVKFVF